MKLPAASGRDIKGDNIHYIPSPYPSPQGEGTSGNPTASGGGIKNIIKELLIFEGIAT
jgi:hypothetical protein